MSLSMKAVVPYRREVCVAGCRWTVCCGYVSVRFGGETVVQLFQAFRDLRLDVADGMLAVLYDREGCWNVTAGRS